VALTGKRTYIGFGFGPIQAGLFLFEAFESGAFCRLVVAEVAHEAVAAVRQAGGHFCINVACSDRVEHAQVGPVEMQDPASEPDRRLLVEAIAEAAEIGTAIPSVGYYVSAGPGSLHRILAQGLRKKVALGGPRAVVYTAENHNHAAEILESAVLAEIPAGERDGVRARVRFLNTVIGKMSGVISDPQELRAQALAAVTPGEGRAFLVEAFNQILISRIRFGETDDEHPFHRGIAVFEEKEDLLPFEEAKLYGHNATHALAAYLAAIQCVSHITDLRETPGFLAFLRAAFVEESGAALVRRHADDQSLSSRFRGAGKPGPGAQAGLG
jgi:mannitol-1-phosphate/altronate dehydrogenase